MSSAQSREQLDFHVLNFFFDDEDNCALTALINEVRFHVIADTSKVRRGKVGQQYAKLLQAVKEDGIESEAESDVGSDIERSSGVDSGIDMGDNKRDTAQDTPEDAEEALHRWMLAPLKSSIGDLAPKLQCSKDQTLEEWYTSPTHFFNLEAQNGELCAVELESNDELERRIAKLLPQISVPKYVQNLEVPWYTAKDVFIVDGSDTPPPYCPSRVRVDGRGETLFLKLVDTSQPQPTKRELSLLSRVAREGLHERIRCPRLEGLVTLTDDHSKIMGFLQTDIREPVPLTMKLDREVPQDLRDSWAAESERTKAVLHEHDIIWGDAKADNFMVDENDDLWIIDFGGSYTEGWVDPALKETEAGDDMGVEKIVNALHDPVANTWDPDTSKSFGGSQHQSEDGKSGKKRKASEAEESGTKRQRRSADAETSYCYCDSPERGRMVACDAPDCERQWFHFECIGISSPRPDDQQWFCDNCRLES